MSTEPEFDQVTPRVAIWHRYDAQVKAEVSATLLQTEQGAYLVDPFAPMPADVSAMSAAAKIAGVILTNGNHARAANDFAAPILARAGAHSELSLQQAQEIASAALPPDLLALPIEGAAAGEIALHHGADGGTLVLGDALIHMGSYGFTFLPAKYCADPRLMRKALRALLDYPFERILFAHGTPITTRARSRLEALLEGGR
ncbi:MAG: hypothetical protein M3Y80_01295 [Verrucomicrobiota bacterium]|nr:hypothetical protein [Verrucomicrobiota bacterium]